eukprot:8704383-Pyramimonas_sp.AAC.1
MRGAPEAARNSLEAVGAPGAGDTFGNFRTRVKERPFPNLQRICSPRVRPLLKFLGSVARQ